MLKITTINWLAPIIVVHLDTFTAAAQFTNCAALYQLHRAVAANTKNYFNTGWHGAQWFTV